ncbi:MAG: ATP-binding protein, partial [Defluviitaleaceae bacterium]|nr:ATP-binding protein [Defluviitaleaceae bacterium]
KQADELSALISKINEENKKFEATAYWYKTILDAIPLAVSVTDDLMHWNFVNKTVEILVGQKREKMIGTPCSNWDRNICNTVNCGVACALRGEKRTYYEQNNLSYQVDTEIIYNMEGKISGFVEVVQDITNIQQLTKQRAEAELASKTKSTFLANMSHEIRTPMNSIIGFSELALDDEISQKTKNYLTHIHENAEGLLQIINDILDISKIESGKMELEEIPFDPHELFAACKTIIEPKILGKDLKIHFYAEPHVGKMPVGDPTRLRQVLLNLLSNAVKFTETGTIKLNAIVKKISQKKITIYFEVKDTGIGMSAEQLQIIFDPFMQAETGTTRKYGGTGLGLSITKNIIEMMGGALIVESVQGKGSKFGFEINFDTVDSDGEKIKNQTMRGELKKPIFEGEILLCEDNEMNRQVICEHLARVGLKTIVAENGEIGVNLVRSRLQNGEKPFDLIFMDMYMPVMDGLEAAAEIFQLDINIPVVAMTANIMSEDRALYQQSGIKDHLGKPFTSQELWHCLLRYFSPVNWNENDETKNENELEKKLIKRFFDANEKIFSEIIDALSKDDVKSAHRLVHTLKSNAAQLKKIRLQKAAEKVENLLKDEKNRTAPRHLNALETELNSVLAELAPVAKKINSPRAHDKNFDAAAAFSKIADRLAFLINDNDPECLNFVGELQMIPGSADLIRHMENYDFKSAAQAFEELNFDLRFEE